MQQTIVYPDRILQRQPPFRGNKSHQWMMALAMSALSAAAFADDSLVRSSFNIPAQRLATGLVEFAEQARIQLVVSSDDVGTIQTAGVSGQYTSEEALHQLLLASGLEYTMTGTASVAIHPQAQLAQAATAPPASTTSPAPVARNQIEEIVVTAQKREEQLQEVPIAITALSATEMENRGIVTFEGVAAASPSITFAPHANSSNTLILYMRGQGFLDPNQLTADGAVGMYLDGFYIARPQAGTFDMADAERVEVLRGPQGTLYGRNTTGGAVNLISKKPTGEFGFKQSLNFGTRNLFRSLTAINLPEVGGVASKITLLKSSIDGYVKNSGSGHDYGEEEQQAGRLQLAWWASDHLQVDYFYEYGTLDSTPTYFQNDSLNGVVIDGDVYYAHPDGANSRTYKPLDLALSTSDFQGHGLTLNWEVSDRLSVRSLTGYRELDFQSIQNFADATSVAPRTPLPGLNNDNIFTTYQFSQEFQFLGDALDGAIHYVAGLYYFRESGSQRNLVNLPTFALAQLREVEAESESKAVFGQIGWTPDILDRRLELTLGGRYTRDSRSAERFFSINGAVIENGAATNTANDLDYSRFNPSFTVNYQWTDTLNTYAKVTTGYKAGGSFVGGPVGSFNATFSPEKVTSYELGMKSEWLERRLQVNLAAFEYEYTDMQLPITADPANGSVFQVYNAGESTMRGMELDVVTLPLDDLTVKFSYAYLDAKFDKIDVIPGTIFDNRVNPVSPYQLGDNVKDVFVLPFAPEHSVNIGVDYVLFNFDNSDLTAHIDWRWQDEVFVTAAAGPEVPGRKYARLPAQNFLDLSIAYSVDLPRGDRAKLIIWGKNITGRDYPITGGPQGASFPIQSPTTGVISPAGYTSFAGAWTPPPSYGIQIQYEY